MGDGQAPAEGEAKKARNRKVKPGRFHRVDAKVHARGEPMPSQLRAVLPKKKGVWRKGARKGAAIGPLPVDALDNPRPYILLLPP